MIFKLDGNLIPTVEEKSINCLENLLTIVGKDTNDMTQQAHDLTKEIDKSGLHGTSNACVIKIEY